MRENGRKFNNEVCIFITQIIVVSLMILIVIIAKFLNGNWFEYLKGFYLGNFGHGTSVSEVTEIDEEKITYLASRPVQASTLSLVNNYNNTLTLPLNDYDLSSKYGWRQDPFGSGLEFHKGVDLSAPKGSSILASYNGTVVLSRYSSSYGNYIIIEHSNGFKTLYAHCEKLFKGVGEEVSSGDIIALVGSTGRSTGPHLHYEILINDENVNPEWYLDLK